jgi:hypothetical protein
MGSSGSTERSTCLSGRERIAKSENQFHTERKKDACVSRVSVAAGAVVHGCGVLCYSPVAQLSREMDCFTLTFHPGCKGP